MKELIFSIKDIFNNQTQSGCLNQYDSEFYHIPPYQRGYKWASDKNGGVTILLNDLWSAYYKAMDSDSKEYYLQYITVKPISVENGKCLEVIDGQQRLTTLSIILSLITSKIEKENISQNKLDYAIRENFFKDHIYKKTSLTNLVQLSWTDLILESPDLDNQDIFYMHAAVRKCSENFSSAQNKKQLESFYQFLLDHVKLIVNSVESHIESETVFRNLNSNKVPLTEAELIKGLLITKVGRQKQKNHTKNFQEIIEIRSNIGRRWDEMSAWANRPDISSFYFNSHSDGMSQLLKLAGKCLQTESQKLEKGSGTKDLSLFNFFLNRDNYLQSFQTIVEVKNKLDNWFDSTNIYNLLGFARYHKNSKSNNLDYLVKLLKTESKPEIKKKLLDLKHRLLNHLNPTELSYPDNTEEIHQILLALNVFVDGQNDIRFDFHKFEKEQWSLEHIFPQTPEGKKNTLRKEDKKAIIQILGTTINQEVQDILNKEKRTDFEKEIYYKALQEHPALNSLGNMCLLTSKDNASNGNMFFDEKRENILNRIQNGSFVPQHTFNVFSKMFHDAITNEMKVWTIKDIIGNSQHMVNSLNLQFQ